MHQDKICVAAAYIRVSTEDQTEYSPAAQLRELKEYASAHSLILDDRYIYADEGISGRRAEKRPAFLRMVNDAKSPEHPFDVVLVHKFDRFARSREDSIVYKSMLRKAGVEVISIKEPLAEGNYSGVMEAIYESFAEAYSINLGQEVKKGMTEKARRGEPQTTAPFGYRMENHQFVPDAVEAPIVKDLFQRFARGDETFFGLAKELNARNVKTHRGNCFENRTVEYILRNPVYIGKLRWNPAGRTRRNFNSPDIMVVDAQHEPLIDMETWEQVQSRVEQQKAHWRYHGRPSYDRKHWLAGIVRCAACGATLIWQNPHYFKCNNYVRGRCRHSQHIAVDALSAAFIHRLQNDMVSAKTPDCRLIRARGGVDTEIRQLRQNLDRIARKQERLTDAYLNGAMEIDEFKALKQAIDAEREAAKAALDAELAAVPKQDHAKILRDAIGAALRVLVSEDNSIAEKYNAANAIVDHCTFDKSTQTLSITYRLTV